MARRMMARGASAPLWLSLCCALLVAFLGCRPNDPQELARWRDGKITVADLDAHLLASGRNRGGAEGEALPERLRQELRLLFARRVLLTEEAMAKLRRDPGFVAQVAKERRSELAREYLSQRNAPFEVTIEEAKARFEARQDSLRREERRAFLHLYLPFQPVATGCSKVEKIRAQVAAGASFEDQIRRFSESADAPLGGIVGPIRREDLRGELTKLIFGLVPGELSAVIEKGGGCHLFQLAQILPAVEPTFELMQSQMISALAEERRLAWRKTLLEEAVARRGLALPGWLLAEGKAGEGKAGEGPKDLKADSLILEVEGEPLFLRDLLPLGAGESVQAAAQQWLGIRVFAALAAEDLGEQKLRQMEQKIELEQAWGRLRQEAIEAELGKKDEAFWRAYLERANRYVKSPEIEASIFTWPLDAKNVLGSLSRPRAFVAALEGGEDPSALFARFVKDPGVSRQALPQTDLRAVAVGRPDLAPAIVKAPAEGAVVGPYRVADRLYVVRLDVVIPERQLGFLEARPQLLRDYLSEHVAEVESSWLDALAAEKKLDIADANLNRFGESLAESLQPQPQQPQARSGGDAAK